MSDQDAPDLQQGQDPDAPETRPAEEEGSDTTPLTQTDLEEDETGSSSPGD